MINFLLSFRWATLFGIGLACFLNSISDPEKQPVWQFVTWPFLYAILFFVVLGYRLVMWIVMDKATLYDVKGLIFRIVGDWVASVIYFLSMIFLIFFFQVYL